MKKTQPLENLKLRIPSLPLKDRFGLYHFIRIGQNSNERVGVEKVQKAERAIVTLPKLVTPQIRVIRRLILDSILPGSQVAQRVMRSFFVVFAHPVFGEPGADGIEAGFIYRYHPEAAAVASNLTRKFLEEEL